MSAHDELARAARELLDSASQPIRYPADKPFLEMALVPANLLDFLRDALEPLSPVLMRPESDWFRGDSGELIEVRYLHIPDVAADEIDEIVCGPVHLETLDSGTAYMTVAGLRVSLRAVKRGHLSITCEPDDCTRIEAAL